MLSCRFAESKVRWTSRVLWMAVVSQSSVKSSRRNSASSSVGANSFLKNFQVVRNEPEVCPFYEYYRILVSEENVVALWSFFLPIK